MPENRYRGGCQCGAVKYEVEVDIGGAVVCNCSRCKPMGFVLAFAPRDKFKLISGAENLTEYRFNTHQIQHLFCRTCGVQGFAYGETKNGDRIAAVNLNCLEGVDARALNPTAVDGRSA
ncbi:aldehyde-activating protein [Bordetella genomosp. 10]|uniref:Aldehyde-activating protein n=1 Tax=Bordetella genomosp. 10 TaxID=1416804 RepID=A0A261SAC4_9BORD|nr:GFA family protein [Bordetella genomosp. 10]OZI34349.1 aldehyde-activating protein [Bordetella genomosp. 10]